MIQNIELSQFITHQYLDAFLTGVLPEATPLANIIRAPKKGSHLATPRLGYTHHGIFIGDNKVIHYSGLADGIKTGPVEQISLKKFHTGRGFTVIEHPDASFPPKKVISRAKSRLKEKSYNLVFNNCEHFVNYCIYNVNTSEQVGAVIKSGAQGTLRALSKGNVVTGTASVVTHSVLHISAYIRGDINEEKLFSEISQSAVVTTSSFYYAGLGQAAIPIPVIGAMIGAGVGYFVGNMLHQSGLIALGDSEVVKKAKKRRKNIEKICKLLIPQIKESRAELEKYIDQYFSDRKKEFNRSFALLDNSLTNWDPDGFASALDEINMQFSKSLQFKNFKEFDQFMDSEEAFVI